MHDHTNIIARDDTLFGVCQGIGEDFGFSPVWLRVALSVGLLVAPKVMIAAYFAGGAVVLLSRLVFPNPRARPAVEAAAPAPAPVAAPAVPAKVSAPALDRVAGQLLPLAA